MSELADDILYDDPFENVELEGARPGEGGGHVYFIACSETMRCKIGHTRGDPRKRLAALQTGSAGKLRLIAAHPGSVEAEKRLHARFASQCVHGEWFTMSLDLFAYLCATVWCVTRLTIHQGYPVHDWMRTGLRMIQESLGELPDDLAALVQEETAQ